MFRKFCRDIKCPKCGDPLKYMGQFEGRPRWYCEKCKEEILDFPWSYKTQYPQDIGEPSPSQQEGFR